MNQQKPTQKLNIQLPPEIAQGDYANLAILTHSPAEFVIDFTRMLPGLPQAKVTSRIIMAPQHAKGLMLALEDNIKKYEKQHGEIKMQGVPQQNARQFGFHTEDSDNGE